MGNNAGTLYYSAGTEYDRFDKGGGNGEGFRTITNMDANFDKYGYIVVYPYGTGEIFLEKEFFTWNNKMGQNTEEYTSNIDDVKFFPKMIDDLKNKFNIDDKRVYATGISNGGGMVYRL